MGRLSEEEKNKLYANAKCTLLLSKSENFGNVVIESLAQGTPVIASKGTPWQELEVRSSGYWIDADVDILAERINMILTMSDEKYNEMRDSAYRLSRNYDIYSNMNEWKSIIDRQIV